MNVLLTRMGHSTLRYRSWGAKTLLSTPFQALLLLPWRARGRSESLPGSSRRW